MLRNLAILILSAFLLVGTVTPSNSQQTPTSEEIARAPNIMSTLTPEVVFCSTYLRIILEHTDLITDQKTKDNFYAIEKDADKSLRKFVQVFKVPPSVDIGKMIISNMQRAVDQYNLEASLGKGPEMVYNTSGNCYALLYTARYSYGMVNYFSEPVVLITEPKFNKDIKIEPIPENEEPQHGGMMSHENGILFYNIVYSQEA